MAKDRVVVQISDVHTHDLSSILFSPNREFLERNNGDQVNIDGIKGKKLGLYFSASWCGPCRQFTPVLIEAYNELLKEGDFEIVFISADRVDESFNGYFSKMPWLAIPFADKEARDRLDELFEVRGIPHLVILDENGKVVSDEGVKFIREYGIEAYPFTAERIKEMKEQEEAARREQTLTSVLVSPSRDFVISAYRNKVTFTSCLGRKEYFSSIIFYGGFGYY